MFKICSTICWAFHQSVFQLLRFMKGKVYLLSLIHCNSSRNHFMRWKVPHNLKYINSIYSHFLLSKQHLRFVSICCQLCFIMTCTLMTRQMCARYTDTWRRYTDTWRSFTDIQRAHTGQSWKPQILISLSLGPHAPKLTPHKVSGSCIHSSHQG